MKQFRTVIDYTVPLDEFFEAMTKVIVPEGEDSFQVRLISMQQIQVIQLAIDCIARTIMAGAQTTGIGFEDIAKLSRHPEVRRSLYPDLLHPQFSQIYLPNITATEQYHMDSLEGAMTDAVTEYFEHTTRTAVRGEDDVILWRVLLSIILETAKCISLTGQDLGISEVALLNYAVTDILPHGQDTNTYILVLTGP